MSNFEYLLLFPQAGVLEKIKTNTFDILNSTSPNLWATKEINGEVNEYVLLKKNSLYVHRKEQSETKFAWNDITFQSVERRLTCRLLWI